MKLTLDHTQRLNLHALLGAQRADVGSIRAIWAIQDKLALDADEEKVVVRENLTDPLVLLGFDETWIPVPWSVKCG